MKKAVFVVFFLSSLVCSMVVFAQTASQEYTVRTVTGKVEREVSPGKWEAVTEGMLLAPSAVINTSLNSSLVLMLGEKVVTIKAMQKGAVEKLVAGVASSKSGIKLGAQVTQSKVSADQDQGRTNISTASTRASDATKDLEWEVE